MDGRLADIGLVLNDVEPLRGASLQISGDLIENLIGLAHDNMVRLSKQDLRFTTRIRSANHCSLAKGPGPEERFANVIFLDGHAADHNEVGPKKVPVQQIFKASIDQLQLLFGQSAATVSRPKGGWVVSSGMRSSIASKLQKEGGKRDHIIRTLIAAPRGGKLCGSRGSSSR